ncbi:dihydrodipicolinate synthase family protein [Adhaeretor mobilis]|uniref:N-acetylneuraminate lyase n=1 Tax=Adhaeretor mobilis TaxID=1930276 RepID=A0A517MVF0_9BACT|nr:dihydrodipicolinate synthase family protein [Adhaeretor mobilis]QDS98861.1 N-acetylneuraminate lyase [Adhaeretor mobilis]
MDYKLRGLLAATYTPMHANGSLNLAEIPKMTDYLKQSGVSGIYVCGSTGEGMSLTSDERRALTEAFVASAKGRLKSVIHVGHNSLSEAAELAAHCQQVGADVISATAPSYYKINSVEMLVDCMAQVAAAAPELPFYYYHMPLLTGAVLDMRRFLELADERIPNLAGMKYTAPMVHEFQACQELMDGRFNIVWGTDEMLLSALAVGAQSAIGSTYNIAAPLNRKLISAFQEGNLDRARELQLKSIQMINLLLKYPFHASIKSILTRFGINCGGCRLPLTSLTSDQEKQLHQELDSTGMSQWLFEVTSVKSCNGEKHSGPHPAIPPSHLGQLAKSQAEITDRM